MHFFLKLLLTNAIIIACAMTGRKFPHLAGLIATMQLTSLIVLIWLHSDNPGNYKLMVLYTEGVLWGIVPTIFFFAAANICFNRQFTLLPTLSAAFGIWLLGALAHQWLLR